MMTLCSDVLKALKGKTLATAESCTGGGIGTAITAVAALPIGVIAGINYRRRVAEAEIGYCIGRNWWHRGIMSEALAAVIKYLFEEVGMNRVAARHDSNNPHSGGVMKKCGMRYEGTSRQSDRNNQGICDESIYAILKKEYK